MQVVLASASPARLGILRSAGLDPIVQVSDVDEDALLAELAEAPPPDRVTELAVAKATRVAERLPTDCADAVVVGCDSMLWVDGVLVGKPGTPQAVERRWAAMAGRTGQLITGHGVLRVRAGTTRLAVGAATTGVRFAEPEPSELAAYVASGEPLHVAGGFTLDGLGGWFVEGIDGDPSNVIGISLPLTRRLLAEVGVSLTELWCGRDGRQGRPGG